MISLEAVKRFWLDMEDVKRSFPSPCDIDIGAASALMVKVSGPGFQVCEITVCHLAVNNPAAVKRSQRHK